MSISRTVFFCSSLADGNHFNGVWVIYGQLFFCHWSSPLSLTESMTTLPPPENKLRIEVYLLELTGSSFSLSLIFLHDLTARPFPSRPSPKETFLLFLLLFLSSSAFLFFSSFYFFSVLQLLFQGTTTTTTLLLVLISSKSQKQCLRFLGKVGGNYDDKPTATNAETTVCLTVRGVKKEGKKEGKTEKGR